MKILPITGLLLFSLSVFALGDKQYTIVEQNSKKGLANHKGDLIIPARYEDLGWSAGSLKVINNVVGYKKGHLWGLLNLKNEKIAEPVYTTLRPFASTYLIASQRGKFSNRNFYGLIDTSGKMVVPFNYYTLEASGDLLIASLNPEDRLVKYGIIDHRNRVVVPIDYKQIRPVNQEVFSVKNFNDEVFLLNRKGKLQYNFPVDDASEYVNGLAVIDKNGKKGVVDEDGKLVLAPQFKKILIQDGNINALPFPEWDVFDLHLKQIGNYQYDQIRPVGPGRYVVNLDKQQFLISGENIVLSPIREYQIGNFKDSLAILNANGKKGIITRNGKIVFEPQFDSIYLTGRFLFLAKKQHQDKMEWLVLNHRLDTLNDQNISQVKYLNESVVAVFNKKFWGILDVMGKEVSPCKYEIIESLDQDYLFIRFLGQEGVMDNRGNWLVTPVKGTLHFINPRLYVAASNYCKSSIFADQKEIFCTENQLEPTPYGFREVTSTGKQGFVGFNGKQILYPVYDSISDCMEDHIFIYQKDGKFGIMDTRGKILTRLDDNDYQDLYPISEDFLGVKINGKFGFVDVDGKLRVANRYDAIGRYKNGLAAIQLLGKWGFIDRIERLTIQPRYDEVGEFEEGVCVVKSKGKFGLVDRKDELVHGFEYDSIWLNEHKRFYTIRDDKFGLMSNKGMELMYPKYETINDLGNGFVIARRRGKFGLLTVEGVNEIPMVYDQMIYDPYNELYLGMKNKEWETFPNPNIEQRMN
jgi:hypothetical protein